jgi:hypothetical protein
MANLTAADHNQFERATLRSGERLMSLSSSGQRAFNAYAVVALAMLGMLTYAAVGVFDGWHHVLVIGDLLLVTYGIARWVSPDRMDV